ncbi:tRNA adenosine(34) deaminase TadA [Erythrobacter sp. LQ02-29]|uniref:tRNA adenosine(34) deaminase TadA n=1 Tax=Erythrobacter sp. LQ02-29 TaxID=2920384 RepID=UPI001F4EA750|nr:tRNA adenosine(34) deaminase TadA [Erythrobacter sp. LQ02-29]MCP9221898.1 tRNA adenosine(34) deaminase TadA [Erythrobacter sp. LQ02-29]
MAGFPSPFMIRALELAREASAEGEVPVGAVVVRDGKIVGEGRNAPRRDHDPTAHAEMLALRQAARTVGSERLSGCDLWVTLEPCAMCAGAIVHARIRRLYYAASDPKGGAVEHGARVFDHPQAHHRPEIYAGLGEREAAALLQDFFRDRR